MKVGTTYADDSTSADYSSPHQGTLDNKAAPNEQAQIVSFSIGICASGDAVETLQRLMRVVQSEPLPPQFNLSRIIVVASEASNATRDLLEKLAAGDRRIELILESERKGKVHAVNTIIERHSGSYLLFVNADAVPEPGAITNLVQRISSNRNVGAVSACPTFLPSGDLNSRVLEFMWATHNASSRELNHLGMSNHASDELMVVRSEALVTLPDDVVNDGAYISGHAFGEGYRILFSEDAKVAIDVPGSVFQLIEQRRRILFGHAQVWRRLGRPPLTAESLMVVNPALSVSMVRKVVASRPSRIMILPVALMVEVVATVLSVADRFISPDRHTVWKRYKK